MQKNKFKSEKGSMAIYAIATILSFLIILGGIFFSSSILRKNQLRTLIKIKDVYAQQISQADEIDKNVEVVNAIAMVENIKYETLQKAINSVPTGGQQTTVLLLKDTAEYVSIPENKNIMLDLNGHEISNIEEESTITSKGNVAIKGGTISSDKSNAINNYGTLEISGTAKLIGATQLADNGGGYPTLCNQSGGNVKVLGGTISATTSYALWNKSGATATISGGTITSENSKAIKNEANATLTISGGTIKAKTDGVLNYGKVEVSGNNTLIEILDASSTTISNQADGSSLILKGGTIKGNAGKAIYLGKNSTVQISGGDISSSNDYTILSSGAMTITGGTIKNTDTNKYAIYNWTSNGGTCTLSGATVIGKKYGI